MTTGKGQDLAGRRVNVYFPTDLQAELAHEAERQGRTMGWLVRRAWRLAKAELQQLPPRSAADPAAVARHALFAAHQEGRHLSIHLIEDDEREP